MTSFKDKVVLISGGTGSLGKVLTRRLLSLPEGIPRKIIIFSRDEAKQHFMRMEYQQKQGLTDEIIYQDFGRIVEFRIGDIRNYASVCAALDGVDIVINAAALKQVPSCEYFPFEAVQTNIGGAQNIVRAIKQNKYPVALVVGVSTDKACKPINVMGMTKAIQERVFINANINCPNTRFVCVRYGNVLASRGSVIPLFHQQIHNGGPVTITTLDMTRFLLSLDKAVDTIFSAAEFAYRGEVYIPRVPSARMIDIARVLIGDRKIEITVTGIRPGEKVHEILISDEEAWHTCIRGDYYVIKPMLPELLPTNASENLLNHQYSSGDNILDIDSIRQLLQQHNLTVEDHLDYDGEFLR